MATPGLRDIWDKDIILPFIDVNPIHKTPFWESGIFTTDGRISKLVGSGSSTFKVPYLNNVDPNLEAYYGNTIYTDHAVPEGISAGSFKGRMAYLNKGFLESVLEVHITGVSPLKAIAATINNYWKVQAENRTLATLAGLRNFSEANDDIITTVVNTTFNSAAFDTAEGQMGEQFEGNGVIVVHPEVKTLMKIANALVEVPSLLPSDAQTISTYRGRRVITSRKGTKTSDGKHISYLLNAGAFVGESVAGRRDLAIATSETAGNGAGFDELWTRRDMFIHPQGFSFIAEDDQLTGGTENEALSASWEDLQNGDYWALGVPEASIEQIGLRVLITNAS